MNTPTQLLCQGGLLILPACSSDAGQPSTTGDHAAILERLRTLGFAMSHLPQTPQNDTE